MKFCSLRIVVCSSNCGVVWVGFELCGVLWVGYELCGVLWVGYELCVFRWSRCVWAVYVKECEWKKLSWRMTILYLAFCRYLVSEYNELNYGVRVVWFSLSILYILDTWHSYINIYIFIFTHTHTHRHTHIYIYMCVCLYVCVGICI